MHCPPNHKRRVVPHSYVRRVPFKGQEWYRGFDKYPLEMVDSLNEIESPTVRALDKWIFAVSFRTSDEEIDLHIERIKLAIQISKFTKGFTTADLQYYKEAAFFFSDLREKLNNYIE